MMLFTTEDLLRLREILLEESRGATPGPRFPGQINLNMEIWINAIQQMIQDSSDQEINQILESTTEHPIARVARKYHLRNPQNMNISEAAEYLNVATNTLYKWTSQGKVPHRKVGSKKLSFCREELDQFLASHRVADDLEIKQNAIRIAGKNRAR